MKGLTVAVVGVGRSGQAAAQLLAQNGSQVVGFDQRGGVSQDDFPFQVVVEPSAKTLGAAIVGLAPKFVVVSPGVPQSSPILAAVTSVGIPIVGEVQLAWDLSHGDRGIEEVKETSWLCVTGTNGKTTTVRMLADILEADGLRAAAVGNVGYPIATATFEGLDAMAVELSSFQLAWSRRLRPTAAICLNVASDHLDWHGSREAYVEAKSHVYDGASVARFFFEDEPETEVMARHAENAEDSIVVPLTFEVPVPEGAIGLEGQLVRDRSGLRGRESEVVADFAAVPLLAASVPAPGGPQSDPADPMVRDALAAVALARAQGVGAEAIQRALEAFRPAPHRRELVGKHGGVTWVDDSKATNVHAAVAAARALPPGAVVWIMGGDTKGQDLRPLARAASDRARAVAVIGAEPRVLLDLLAQEAPQVPVYVAEGYGSVQSWMTKLVRACAEMAQPGDTVLLAPGCASWDQFESYVQRGEVFKRAVEGMSAAGGE